jgi:hypothetical protein
VVPGTDAYRQRAQAALAGLVSRIVERTLAVATSPMPPPATSLDGLRLPPGASLDGLGLPPGENLDGLGLPPGANLDGLGLRPGQDIHQQGLGGPRARADSGVRGGPTNPPPAAGPFEQGGSARASAQAGASSPRDAADDPPTGEQRRRRFERFLASALRAFKGLLVAAAAAYVLHLAWRLWRGATQRPPARNTLSVADARALRARLLALEGQAHTPAQEIMARFAVLEGVLAQLQRARPDYLPTDSHMSALARSMPPLADDLGVLRDGFARVRYGGHAVTDGQLAAYRDAFRSVLQTLGAGYAAA